MIPDKFVKHHPGVAVYGRIVRRIARRYNLRARMYLEFPLCRVTYNGTHHFYIDVTFYKITCKKRCEYNAYIFLGLNPHKMY